MLSQATADHYNQSAHIAHISITLVSFQKHFFKKEVNLMRVFENINLIFGIFFLLCYSYQIFYIFVPFFKKQKNLPNAEPNNIAILIAARNEEGVIGNLLDSINCQKYPKNFIKTFVIADNCTDSTAIVARAKGAYVYERFNQSEVGKGYALDFLLDNISKDFDFKSIDAFIVLDADNILEPDYVAQMNKTFSSGYRILTSYRNSKNYGENWISSGYALWFLRESKYLNNSRMLLGTSCAISGTGFLVSRELIEERGGWGCHLLTEDIEFTCENIANGEKIGYCDSAVLYDEQPTTFEQSWKQRMRWSKGFLQVLRKHSKGLLKGIFSLKFTSCYDMFMTIAPAYTVISLSLIFNALGVIIGIFGGLDVSVMLSGLLFNLISGYFMLFFAGLITTITEWNSIHASTRRKIFSVFTFPVFMYTYVPISIAVFFKKVEWSPIKHGCAVNIDEIKAAGVSN